jgi:hypothetical protein
VDVVLAVGIEDVAPSVEDVEVMPGGLASVLSSFGEGEAVGKNRPGVVLFAEKPVVISPSIVESPPKVVELLAAVFPPSPDPPVMLDIACFLSTRVSTRPITLHPAGTFPSKMACTNPSALSAKMA